MLISLLRIFVMRLSLDIVKGIWIGLHYIILDLVYVRIKISCLSSKGMNAYSKTLSLSLFCVCSSTLDS